MIKVTSLELSKKLKEAGVEEGSERFWARQRNRWELYDHPYFKELEKQYSAFDCTELLEMLPSTINLYMLTMVKDDAQAYCAFYQLDEDELDGEGHDFDSPAEALGLLYLWCLENGHIK